MPVLRLSYTDISADAWDALVTASPQGSLYTSYAYATAMAPGWEAIIIEEKGSWRAALPFLPKTKWGIRYTLQPAFCQTWGPLLPHFSDSYKDMSEQHRLLGELAQAVSSQGITQLYCHPSLSYLLPFQHEDFHASVRYTHQLALKTPQLQAEGFSSQARRKLRKGEKAQASPLVDISFSDFMELVDLNMKGGRDLLGGLKQGREKLATLSSLSSVQIRGIQGADGQCMAAGLFGSWERVSYYLIGAQHPAHETSGYMYTLMAHAMAEAHRMGDQSFDFEGSMIPGIARFFRQFGSVPVPYYSLTRKNLPIWLRWIPV